MTLIALSNFQGPLLHEDGCASIRELVYPASVVMTSESACND